MIRRLTRFLEGIWTAAALGPLHLHERPYDPAEHECTGPLPLEDDE